MGRIGREGGGEPRKDGQTGKPACSPAHWHLQSCPESMNRSSCSTKDAKGIPDETRVFCWIVTRNVDQLHQLVSSMRNCRPSVLWFENGVRDRAALRSGPPALPPQPGRSIRMVTYPCLAKLRATQVKPKGVPAGLSMDKLV